MATLLVQEAMGFKVDREAVAMAVLPQLWQMAMGPRTLPSFLFTKPRLMDTQIVLNVEQFQRFMAVIKKLGDRVEREHGQFLRDSQRLEDRSAIPTSGATPNPVGGEVNFENLVGGGDGVAVKPDTVIDGSSKGWDEDDVWGSIFSSNETVSTDLFALAQVYLSPFSNLLGDLTNSISSTGHANNIVTVNPDDPVQFDNTARGLKFKS